MISRPAAGDEDTNIVFTLAVMPIGSGQKNNPGDERSGLLVNGL